MIFQKYKINYEFIFGKYKPQLVHTLDQFKIASCLPFFPLFLTSSLYSSDLRSVLSVVLLLVHRSDPVQTPNLSHRSCIVHLLLLLCSSSSRTSGFAHVIDLSIVFTLSMVHVSPLREASLRSVLLCSLSGFLSGRSVHVAFPDTGGFASRLGQPLYGLLPELSRPIRQFFTHHTQCDSNIPFDSASIHSIGAESPTIP